MSNSWYFLPTSDKGQPFLYSVKIVFPLFTVSMWARKASTALPTKRAEPRRGSQATPAGQEITVCFRGGPTRAFLSNRNETCSLLAEAGCEKLVPSS